MAFYIATFDIGTTEVKAALADRDGGVHFQRSIALETYGDGNGSVEQDAGDWYDAVQRIASSWWQSGVDARRVSAIALSGQMQNFLPLDQDHEPLHRAVLYSDKRPLKEAEEINARHGADNLWSALENPMTAASILPKLVFWRASFPQAFGRLRHVVLGAKDYVVLRLTGRHATDRTNASTTGLYRPKDDAWHAELLADYGFSLDLMPRLLEPGEQVGGVSALAARQTGFVSGTPVLCGLGDAGAATLGVGVLDHEDAYLHLGTTGWLARLTQTDPVGDMPVGTIFRLAGIIAGKTLQVAPVLNAGNILQWALTLVGHRPGEDCAEYFRMAAAEVQGVTVPDGLLFVPYLHAERCPVELPAPRGALLGVTGATTRAQILLAVLEGAALSLRWCAELLGMEKVGLLKVVGGGARSEAWLRMIADNLNVSLLVKPDAHLHPLRGLAALAAVELEWSHSIKDFLREADLREQASNILHPQPCDEGRRRRKFERFKQCVETLGRLD
ncbi:xylulokinase [Chromobacterium violaceum]|uniref:xylulokinase n=1 Tax=Chromobacterium violaceum TaxID=536 RepID=UPI001C8BA903|nr:hypothetical protein [Chromobacterium violaceum]